ncbi:DUF2207 domain-containing protein [Herbiconiux sp. P18]|uniref:DUF2207 domain-containing protein n=1 Tax=Herbiconiux liangxiaofengii TaxID=3342795 RepID=UPI0035B83EAC
MAEPDVSDQERIPDEPPRHTALWVVLSRWLLGTEAWLRSHGGARLRNGIRAFWAVVAAAGLVLLFGPVINAPLTLDDITGSAETVTDTWIARDFTVSYDIQRTDDGRLTARIEERITAQFPDGVDEHGIRRVLATQYQGHDLAPSDIAATMDGEPVDLGRAETSEDLTLTLDRPGGDQTALDGTHEFVLSYVLHDLAYSTVDESTGDPVDLLEWDVFGPDWQQGLSGLDVSVTLPDDVDAQLVRQPRGTLAWLLIGGGEWLTPETNAPGTVTYGFSNDQNMPPYAQARFRLSFEPGTFTMPAPTALYWVQVYGPLAPLAILALTLLFALAARAVAWSDARGRPWFVAQYDPPAAVSPRLAAQIVRQPVALELASRLDQAQAARRSSGSSSWWKRAASARKAGRPRPLTADRAERLRAAARAAARVGRIGDRPRALLAYLRAPERRSQVPAGYRRIPRGFVRDLFIAAPLALTLVQWGIVRQLSFQTKLAVVWWPVAFVLVSSAVALVVLAIALSSRPLTRKGALVKQHLRGIGVFAERTQLLKRGPLNERLVPYAVLLAPPREAGRQVGNLIIGELGDADAARGWRTSAFLTGPRLLLRLLGVAVVVAAIVAMSVLTPPYPRSYDYATYSGDVPGTLFTKVQSVDISAELGRDEERRARLAVTETLTVQFDDEGSSVPQFAQQWPNELEGQSLGLEVQSVRVDGAEVPFDTRPDADTVLMSTRLAEVLSGSHDVQVDYTLGSAAVAADGADGGLVDRVRWAALLNGWEYDSGWGDDPAPDPVRVELRMSDELAAEVVEGGWLTEDTSSSEHPRSWDDAVLPFGAIAADEVYGVDPAIEPDPAAEADTAGGDAASASASADGSSDGSSHVLELVPDAYGGWPFDLTVTDLGARLDFPAGTFAGPDAEAKNAMSLGQLAPMASVVGLGALALLLGFGGVLLKAARRELTTEPGAVRDLLLWFTTGVSVAGVLLFIWTSGDMPSDWPELLPLALGGAAALLGGIAAVVAAYRPSKKPT